MKPYSFYIKNVTDKPLRAVIGGCNNNFLKVNYGSDIGVVVWPADPNVKIEELIAQTGNMNFNPGYIRFITNGWKDIPMELEYHFQDINSDIKIPQKRDISLVGKAYAGIKIGEDLTYTFNLYDININANNYLTLLIKPNTKIQVHLLTEEQLKK